jgi:beta-lactamase regulating signal transducer with metallopeptidase domain
MKLPLIDILLSDAVARAICWTLVHSLWQGILAAALAAIIIGCTRRLPAVLRYNLLAVDGLLFLLAAGITFYYEMGQAAGPVKAGPLRATSETAKGPMAFLQQEMLTRPVTLGNVMQQTGNYLNAHAGMITLIWLACLSIQLLRLTGGLYRLSRIRLQSVPPPGEDWNERLLVLTRRLGIGRTVTLLQSQWVKAPSAFGFLKPSILVPLGMLSQLPPDQVETILLHELAHIRRGDFVVNLLLLLTEAIFFFNPGMRWLASLIRREREACCDDIVLAGTPDRNSYFEALVAFTQWAVNGQAAGGRSYAMQLSGGNTDLLWRIKRMLNQENKKLQIMEKAILSVGLMALVSVSLISMKGKEGRTTKIAPRTTTAVAKTDTLPQSKQDSDTEKKISFRSFSSHTSSSDGRVKSHVIAIDQEGNRYEVIRKNDEVVEFMLNDQQIPREEYSRYSGVLAGIEAERKKIPKAPVAPVPPAPIVSVAPTAPVAPATPRVSAVPATLATPKAVVTPVTPITPVAPVAPVNPAGSNGFGINERAYHAPTRDNPLVYWKHPDPYIERIVPDLIENGLIDNVNRFSFTLTAEGLVVNGIRAPDDIFLTFKTKYVIYPKSRFIYSQYYTPQGSGSHCEVNINPDAPTSI